MNNLIPLLMFSHWLGDFVCQPRWIAEGKSKSNLKLGAHVFIYMWAMACPLVGGYAGEAVAMYLLVAGGLHFIVDWCTSRASGWFYTKGSMYGFFTTIGFDQLLHFLCLYYTLPLLGAK